MQTEENNNKLLHDLYERIKELNCLYSLANLSEESNISFKRIFQGAVDLLPPSWQYPEITCARILFKTKVFKTSNFKKTNWKQSAIIKVFGKETGTVEVYYLQKKPDCYEGPFLKEERALINAVVQRLGKILECKSMEDLLKKSETKLRKHKISLEQKNMALREIILQIELEKKNIKNNIMANLDRSVFPILEKLKNHKEIRTYIDLLQHHLNNLTSSFSVKITEAISKLTPREIEICNMIKGNLSSKEISNLLNISHQTVEKHRKNIRKKFKLLNKSSNLSSFLHKT